MLQALFELARESIEERLYNKKFGGYSNKQLLYNEHQGVFVSLYLNGQLRGCGGYIEIDQPLYKSVYELAKYSAFEDDRFYPITIIDYEDISLELSILSLPKPIKSLTEIKLGTHGLILKHAKGNAVFLPHVASSNNWDINRTIYELMKKAGLSKDDLSEASWYSFTSDRVKEPSSE
jgi:AmmeMemoRadiSam system protein A